MWIVSSLSSFKIVDNREFRKLFNYSIPKSDSIKREIVKLFEIEEKELIYALSNQKSKISFTVDKWSSFVNYSYIGITCHYINSDFQLISKAIALREFYEKETTISKIVLEVLEEFNLIDKTGWFTLDNANENNNCFDDLKIKINDFDQHERRIRCMCHTINLAVQEFLKNIAPINN